MKKTIFVFLAMFIINNDVVHAEAPKVLTVAQICPLGESKEVLVCKIKEAFPEEPEVMLAIAMAESKLNNDAVGYNCYYEGKSKACKVGDRSRSWSVDCFAMQQNFPNRKTCPDISIDDHLKDVRKLYDKRKCTPWSVFNSGVYKQYLPEADRLLALYK